MSAQFLRLKSSPRQKNANAFLKPPQPKEDPFQKKSINGKNMSSPTCIRRRFLQKKTSCCFIRDYNPYLSGWEKDLLTIVQEESQYFIPQMENQDYERGLGQFLAS